MLLCCFTYKVLEHTRCVWAGHCLVSPRSMKFQPKRALSQQLYHSTSQGHAEQAEKIPFEKIPASKTIHLWNYAWSLKHKCKAVKLELSPHVMVSSDSWCPRGTLSAWCEGHAGACFSTSHVSTQEGCPSAQPADSCSWTTADLPELCDPALQMLQLQLLFEYNL